MLNRFSRLSFAFALSGFVLTGCGDEVEDTMVDAGGMQDAGPDSGQADAGGNNPPADIYAFAAGGSFAPLGTYQDLRGKAHILRGLDGKTTVEVHVEGLTAGTTYQAHVHALPCEIDDAGGHYMIDPTAAAGDEANEIWLELVADDNGVGRDSVTVSHLARPDAQSVVVHDPDAADAKMACANLQPGASQSVALSGTFAPYADADQALDGQIAGTVSATISAQGTDLSVDVQGLDAGSTYEAHVHALPCDIDDAGGHYKIDPTVPATQEANELWPAIQPDADGNATDTQTFTHAMRMDGQAVVIHREDTGNQSLKVACATFELDTELPELETTGAATLLPDATDLGYDSLSATATIVRDRNGTTTASLEASGLKADQDYPIHVHAYSCALDSGGPHYKLDPGVADTQEANEMWLNLTADTSGNGTAELTVDHLARPEAQSIVIHAAEDNTKRIACMDLK